jgi:hypothetical protein
MRKDKAVEKLPSFAEKLNAKCFISDKNFYSQTSERVRESFGSLQLYNGIIKLDNF